MRERSDRLHGVHKGGALLFTRMINVRSIAFAISLFAVNISTAITLDENDVSEADKSRATKLRDNTEAPKSLIGSAATFALQGLEKHNEACKSGAPDFVIVNFDVVGGLLSTEGVDRVFSMSPVDSTSGVKVEQNASRNGAAVHGGANRRLAGEYRWTAQWDKNRKVCSGTIRLSGKKCNATINVYPDCRGAGYSEF